MNLKSFANLFLVTSLVTAAVYATPPTTEPVPFSKVYVPVGFDDNDRVQVTIEGSFSDSCYHVGPYETKIDAATQTISIAQSAYHYSGFCLQMFVPYVQVVDLGILPAGEYSVVDAKTGNPLGKLPIGRATTAGSDDYLYASVSDAFVVTDPAGGPAELVLQGTFTDRCTRWKETRVLYYQDVVVVQPIVEHIVQQTPEQVATGTNGCGPDATRFQKREPLSAALKGTHLLHVRTLNGQAINKLVQF